MTWISKILKIFKKPETIIIETDSSEVIKRKEVIVENIQEISTKLQRQINNLSMNTYVLQKRRLGLERAIGKLYQVARSAGINKDREGVGQAVREKANLQIRYDQLTQMIESNESKIREMQDRRDALTMRIQSGSAEISSLLSEQQMREADEVIERTDFPQEKVVSEREIDREIAALMDD